MNLLDIARTALAEVALAPPDAPTTATPAQAAELHTLVARVAADWPEAERAEALAVALADPEASLTSFRLLAAELPAPPRQNPAGPHTSAPLAERDPRDDRRTCHDCTNQSGTGRCLSAWQGHPPAGSGRSYSPIGDLLRRCERYRPKPDDPDQRIGADRWPEYSEVTKNVERGQA